MPTSNGGGQRSQGNVEEDLFKDDLNSGNQSTKGKNSIWHQDVMLPYQSLAWSQASFPVIAKTGFQKLAVPVYSLWVLFN